MKKIHDISVILFQECNQYIVQCIDYDISSQGNTINQAIKSFKKIFIGQIILDEENGREPLKTTPKININNFKYIKLPCLKKNFQIIV